MSSSSGKPAGFLKFWPRTLEKLKHLACSNRSPGQVALGVGIGVFICTLPVYGLHTLLLVAFAFMVPRANKLAMFIGTNFSLPVTLPFITWCGYEIGRYVLPRDYPPLSWDYFRHFDFKLIGDFYGPLFVGSVILGVICGCFFFVVTYIGMKVFLSRKKGASGAG